MKKAILLTILLTFFFCSCGNQIKKLNKQDYLEILNNSKTFVDEGGKEILLSDYQMLDIAERYVFEPVNYHYIDLDGNSRKELIVDEKGCNYLLILFVGNDNKIHGYSLSNRCITQLKSDGEFMQLGGAGLYTIVKTTDFKNNKPTFKKIVEIDEVNNIYKFNGKQAKEEAQEYFSNFLNKSAAEWYEFSNPLLLALIGTNDVTKIEAFKITHKYGGATTDITDNTDLEFLKEYTYSHEYPMEDLHNLLIFPKNQLIQVISGNKKQTMYLMDNGSIALQVTIENDGVTETKYDVYTAGSEYMLTEDKLIELLKKYGVEIKDTTTDTANISIKKVRKALKIPDSANVTYEIGEPFYKESFGAYLTQVDFYENGELVAGASVYLNNSELGGNIIIYGEQ